MTNSNIAINTNPDMTDFNFKLAGLEHQIAELEIVMSLSESQQWLEEYRRLLDKVMSAGSKITLTDAEKSQFNIANENSQLARMTEEMNMLKHTLTLNLVEVKTDFVITEKALISPSGFHPDQKVFVQNEIMICTNNRKPKAPSSNVALYLQDVRPYDVKKADPLSA